MLRVAVLASGRGSNFAALLESERNPDAGFRLVGLYSDRTEAPALQRARAAGLDAASRSPRDYADRAAFDAALFGRVARIHPDLIVCAGYMRIISATALAHLTTPMINIHPSLLPLYPGLDTHARALAAGDAEHGVSVHVVTAELDGGPVIAQARVKVCPGDTPELLAARVLEQEHRLLPACVRLFANGRLRLTNTQPYLDDMPLEAPLQLNDGSLVTARSS